MKRTCKTCAEHDRYQRCLLPTTTAKDCYRPDDQPACEHWNLAVEELTEAMCASVDKAREKHPVFLDVWPEPKDADINLSMSLAFKRKINKKNNYQLASVLCSEVFEFLAEVARGDFDRALKEAGDVMAVLYRTLNGDGQKKQEGKE